MQRSPLAPETFPELFAVKGVSFASTSAKIRYSGRTDLMLAHLVEGTTVAGVFTKSLCPSAPVDWCRKILARGSARGLVVNSGNANAFTGRKGLESVERTAQGAAAVLGCSNEDIYIASTGVIGEILADNRITDALPSLKEKLSETAWPDAAQAIMTTDTFPKGASRKVKIGNAEVAISGFAKGSGMIAPNMGTMLGFIFTDAKIPADVLQDALTVANARSFNSITVDGDTSTSDTALLFATGQVQGQPDIKNVDAAEFADFRVALEEVLTDLAKQIVMDGEGAEKLVTIEVSGAEDEAAARRIGLAIGNSPLVKTAVAGQDANWGRIVMAVGKAGERADRDKLSISIGGIEVARQGAVVPGYDETPVAAHMKGRDIVFSVDVGIGDGRATVWTCDLTHRYIDINADYRS